MAYNGTGAPPGAITYVLPGDSAATIQSKLNLVQPGNSLVFTAGSYDFGGTTIVGKSGVTVWANGQVVINNAPGADTHGAFNFSGRSDWTIGGKAPGQGFVFNGSLVDASNATGNWAVGNCQFNQQQASSWDGSAIRMNGASYGTVVNNDFNGVGGTTLGMYNMTKITISGNHFTNCYQPISLQEPMTTDTSLGQDIVIRNNSFVGTQRAAIEAGSAATGAEYFSGLVVDNNYFDNFNNTAGDGTLLPISLVGMAAQNTTVTNNYISRGPANAGVIAAAIEFAGSGVVSGNTIVNFTCDVLTYQSGWNVHDNFVYNDGSSPIFGFGNNGSGTGTFGPETTLTAAPAVPALPSRMAWGGSISTSVESSVSYTLDSTVQNLTLTGASNISGTGNALANTITGNSGNNALDGKAGADIMSGFAGNDTCYVDNVGDKVIEAVGGGTDSVYSTVSWSMAAGQEIEYLLAYGAGAASGVTLSGNELNNSLYGGSGNDVLNGGAGDDRLNGGAGADTTAGGTGNDIYYVDNTGDKAVEAVGGGTDTVYSTVNWSMAAGQEIEYLLAYGTGAMSGVTLSGNELNNSLYGGDGNDGLNGGAGNDVLNGRAGADTVAGGTGNDTYYVDNTGDKAIEAVGGGTDYVYSTVSWSMVAGQEIEYLLAYGTGATSGVTLSGNELNNSLYGGSGNDVLNGGAGDDRLNGGAGADTMAGGTGNDAYYVDNTGDKAVEAVGGGTDTVYSTVSWSIAAGQEIEYLQAYGAGVTSGVTLTGNAFNNTLIGGSANDVLNGGGGNDRLTGGGGQDTFLFNTALSGNVDTITDFASNESIQLSRSVFAAITTLGTMSASAFYSGAAAHAAGDRIIYNSTTGNLFYDSDGSGAAAAVQFAHLNGNPTVTNTNFNVVA